MGSTSKPGIPRALLQGELGTSQSPTEYYAGQRLVFLLFLFYVLYWYLQGSYRFPALGSIRFEFVLGLILSVLAIPSYLNNPTRVPSGLGVWVGLLFLCMGLMVLFSEVPDVSSNIFVDRVFKFGMLGFFLVAYVTTPDRLCWFVVAFLVACFKMEFEGVLGYLDGSMTWENQGVQRLHGATPNYDHPNSFAGMALGSVPFIVYLVPLAPKWLRLGLMVQVVCALLVILFTGSRTGYIGFVGGVFAVVLRSNRRGRAILIALLAGGMLAFVIPQEYAERFASIYTQEDKEGQSIGLRKEILADAFEVFVESPLGIGVGAFPAVRARKFGRSQDTHNLYLEVATNLGVQGFVVFSGLVFSVLVLLSRIVKSTKQQIAQVEAKSGQALALSPEQLRHLVDLRLMNAVANATFIFVVIRLCVGFLGMDLYEIYWWFAAGLGVALWNLDAVARRRTRDLGAGGSFANSRELV